MVDARQGEEISFPPVNPATYEKLYQVFKDDVEQLEQLLGWDLSHWAPGRQQVNIRAGHKQYG
jgi:hypothetical protein